MPIVTAQLNNYRQSPRKVRLVAKALQGKKVPEAKRMIGFIIKRAGHPISKLLDSAIANAKNLNLSSDELSIKSITVNAGSILYRRRPVAHGAAHPIRKRTSHIKITLGSNSKP
jgi:large subunit ribosomal protein L22